MAKVTEQISKGFQGLPPWAKGTIAVVAVGGGVYLLYRLLRGMSSDTLRQTQETNQILSELDNEVKKTGLTYPKSQYSSFANELQQAGFDVGTDEDAMYSIFRKLKNDADYLQLTAAWGKPTRTIYDWGVGRPMTLTQFLRSELSDSEIRKINTILAGSKIKYRV